MVYKFAILRDPDFAMTNPIRLREEWRDQARLRGFEPTMNLTEDGLVLGHGTILAKRCGRQGHPTLALDSAEERISALLSVAYGRAVPPNMFGSVQRASRSWQDGETCLALIHLARAGLPPLPDREAGYRLFAADKLLASGIALCDLLKACDLDPGPFDLAKTGFNPDEPRVPAGSPNGGEWIGDAGSGSSHSPRDLPTEAGRAGVRHLARTLHGYATVYNKPGSPTATGDKFNPNRMTGAVLPGTLPLRSTVTVRLDRDPGRAVEVYINDHGLYQIVTNSDGTQSRRPLPGRVIDLSPAAGKALTSSGYGKAMVTVTLKSTGSR